MGPVIRLPALAAALVLVTWMPAMPRAREARTPATFFIAIHGFSDVPSTSYEDLLDVAQEGPDVRVRLVRMSLLNPNCSTLSIRAVEQVLPHTTVGRVTGPSACAIAPADVGRAIAKAKPARSVVAFAGETQTVVARCGAEQRVFDFPSESTVDRVTLRRVAPEVDALWRVYARLRERSFGQEFNFGGPPSRQRVLEDAGDRALPDLVSGRYQAAYADWPCSDEPGKDCRGNYLAWYLRDYHGSSSREPCRQREVESSSRYFTNTTSFRCSL